MEFATPKAVHFAEIVELFLKDGWNLEIYAKDSSFVSMASQLDEGGNQINDEFFEGETFEKSVVGLIDLCMKNRAIATPVWTAEQIEDMHRRGQELYQKFSGDGDNT